MIAYFDSSALVKRYVTEAHSDQTRSLVGSVEIAGTSIVSRVEVVAALAKGVRVGALEEDKALRGCLKSGRMGVCVSLNPILPI